MPQNLQFTGYLLHKSFFDVVGHKGAIDRFDYELLLTINYFGGMTAEDSFKLIREYWRAQRHNNVQQKFLSLNNNNYLLKKGAKYHLTDKSMLLIATVERKLKALVEQHIGKAPVGRPKKS